MASIRLVSLALAACLALSPLPACAWGDEGHEIIGTIADSLLTPKVRRIVHAILADDDDPLAEHDIAAASTWADHLRSADPDGARRRTSQWHFADIELRDASLDRACFDHPSLPPGSAASVGVPQDCIVDKIDQFTRELAAPATPPDERLLALKFLLHFVGDVHQPLHASDDDDRGGNDKRVSAMSYRANTLHHFWDTEFVRALGSDPATVAANLLSRLSPADLRRWSTGTPADWARESFQLARRDSYGLLPPPNRNGNYRLSDQYIETAVQDCREQLTKAGIRLAMLLNRAFANAR